MTYSVANDTTIGSALTLCGTPANQVLTMPTLFVKQRKTMGHRFFQRRTTHSQKKMSPHNTGGTILAKAATKKEETRSVSYFAVMKKG